MDTADSKNLRDIADKMGALNKNTKSLAGNMSFLTNAFTGFIGFLGVREITKMSDEMQNLTNRLKLTAQAGESTAETLQKIGELADRTKQSVVDVGTVYSRLAVSLKAANPSANELISLTETLINTFKIAGSTSQETASTIIQLSQSFSSGKLQGQELRAVLQQNATLAGLLRKEFGADIGKKAEQGLIKVSDVLRVLQKNATDVNEKAGKLTATFDQTLTQSMNKVTLSIGELNQQFGLSEKFATSMAFVVDNLGNILIVMGGAAALLATVYFPTLLVSLQALIAAGTAFALSNPVTAALTAIIVVGALVYNNFEKLKRLFYSVQAGFFELAATIEERLLPLKQMLDNLFGGTDAVDRGKKNISELRAKAAELRQYLAMTEKKPGGGEVPDAAANLKTLEEKLKNMNGAPKLKKVKEILGELNTELIKGKITLEEYNSKLVNFDIMKLNREFKEGKFDIFTYNAKLKELNLQELNRQLKVGVISMSEFRDQSRKLGLDELTAKFKAGKISLTEYNSELIKLSDKFLPGQALQSGTAAYLESIGTLSENIAKAVTSTFGHLEDTLTDFIKTGSFDFAKFTQSILDDLTRIIIRASIIRPLAGAILNSFGGTGPTPLPATNANYDSTAAKGASFDHGVRKFASGGIVSSPTPFGYGGGKKGLMGEAGTEAIIPLRRGANGELGVGASQAQVTVNIVNQAGANVQQTESTGPNGEKTIEVMITNRVREGLLTGRFDGAMKQSYGVTRKGS